MEETKRKNRKRSKTRLLTPPGKCLYISNIQARGVFVTVSNGLLSKSFRYAVHLQPELVEFGNRPFGFDFFPRESNSRPYFVWVSIIRSPHSRRDLTPPSPTTLDQTENVVETNRVRIIERFRNTSRSINTTTQASQYLGFRRTNRFPYDVYARGTRRQTISRGKRIRPFGR